ncbi:MAG: hypothetical protein HZC47_11220 [Methanobacterium sp.]|uniref:hypothetical protein n=1 Tax=Methanobacterium sp. TaxID=2164 RepID=UPI003D646191|nr:hypothetical protein [Methanobacterium sp.]
MDKNRLIPILLGIGITLYFLASYLGSKSPLDLFFSTIGLIGIVFGFFSEYKKVNVSINFIVTIFSVNVIQWLILIYTFYYNPVYIKTVFYSYLFSLLLVTIILVNQMHINHLNIPENGQKAKIGMLTDKTKLILIVTGVIIIIGSLAGFIAYYAPIFLYGITLGMMAFIYGYYHRDKKDNVSTNNAINNDSKFIFKKDNVSANYAVAMGSILILQWVILCYFFRQFSKDDFTNAFSLSIMINIFFYMQIRESDLKYIGRMRKNPTVISNEKKDMILGISAIAIFAVIAILIIK